MISLRVVVLSALLSLSWSEELTFPPDFMFGAASSAYQVEGGWNAADKGESQWDTLTHEMPSKIADNNTGDIACDSYHQWRRDIEMIAELGLNHYRFSLSWTRILPTGFANYISEDGKNYYNNLIDGLLARNIEPLVTIHHFDMPAVFQDMGGFTNPLIVNWFADYARVVYELFADRVKFWISINEPLGLCDAGYNGIIAPALNSPDLATYLCSKYVLLAHAKAWRIYDEEYKPKYHGKMAFSQLGLWFEPFQETDVEGAELTNAFCEERFAHPVFNGGWPPALEKLIEEKSFEKGFSKSRLLPFTDEEIKFIKGTYDYYALNHYTTYLVKTAEANESGVWPFTGSPEVGVVFRQGEGWETAAPSWFGIYPQGLRHQLNWLRKKYGDVEIMITENGYAGDANGGLRDVERVQYMKNYLEEVLKAINIDKINLTAYTVWTLMDNFELLMGYTIKYGIYQVDFNSRNRTRTARDSALYYAGVIRDRSLYPLVKAGPTPEDTFPPDFKFGAASSSYQVEGAWNISDKSESIWDHFTHHRPEMIADGQTGDVAADSYHLWRRDIEIAKELGLDYYRFSISWVRLLPSGFPNYISEDGKNYYNNLIDGLLANNIQPLVTIYHYELPQIMQDLGGWTNPLIVDWFADYARVVYTLFGDRVKVWLTMNEPLVICDAGYLNVSPPAVMSPDLGVYLCNKYVLLAHAKAWRIYDEEFKPKYHGIMSVSQLFLWFEPETEADTELAELVNELCEARFTYPIYSKEGGWPPKLNKVLEDNSFKKGFKKSRVLAFTPEEIEFVKGTYDFYALNHYTTFKVRAAGPNDTGDWPFSGSKELGVVFGPDPTWKLAGPVWFGVYPQGLRHQLNWLKKRYGDLHFMITETGYGGQPSDGLQDYARIEYHDGYLHELLLAIKEDGINVTSYTVWSLIDTFEWLSGFKDSYGLYQVDFSSPNKTRTPKASATYYRDIIRNHGFTNSPKTISI